MHEVHFLEVFHAGCYLRGHVNQRAETATRRTKAFQKFRAVKLASSCTWPRATRFNVCTQGPYTKTDRSYRLAIPQMTTLSRHRRTRLDQCALNDKSRPPPFCSFHFLILFSTRGECGTFVCQRLLYFFPLLHWKYTVHSVTSLVEISYSSFRN